MIASVFSPLVGIAGLLVNALPDWTTPAPFTIQASTALFLGKANQFLPVTELFMCITLYSFLHAPLLAYRATIRGVNIIRGCG